MRRLYTILRVSFLVLIRYYNYVRCNCCGKLGEVYTGPLCTQFSVNLFYFFKHFNIYVGSFLEMAWDL